MLLLIDENVPQSVTEFLRDRGHDVRFVRDLLLPGTPDPLIARLGEELGAIVVTWNRRDFKNLTAPVPPGYRRRFRRLGWINFNCRETRGRQRIEQVIEVVEFHFALAQKRPDQQFRVEILDSSVRLWA